MPKRSLFGKFNFSGIQCVAKCVDVYDGDTITLEVDFREVIKKYYPAEFHNIIDQLPYKGIYPRCRMAGYNSAEISRCSNEEKEKGYEAKEFISSHILGNMVHCHFLEKGEGILIKLKNEDPYGRPIIDVHLLNDKNEKTIYLNELMISSGHAASYNGSGEKKY